MTYKVMAPLVLAVDPDGQTHHVYAGGVIDWLSEAQKAQFLADGLVVDVDKPVVDAGRPESVDGKPHAAATKAELIAWLVDNAVKPDGGEYTAGSLQPHSKDDLRAMIDAVD